MSTFLILGATSGMGKALSQLLCSQGLSVVLAARNPEKLTELVQTLPPNLVVGTLAFDALKLMESSENLSNALTAYSIDGAFLFFGVMYPQQECFNSWDKSDELLKVNISATVSVLGQLLSYFEKRSSGFISCVTSVAGERPRKNNVLYATTKAAINTFLEGLRAIHPSEKILIQTIKAGPTDTPMAYKSPKRPFMVSPEYTARQIWRAVLKRKEIAFIPSYWRWIMIVIKLLPNFIFRRLSI